MIKTSINRHDIQYYLYAMAKAFYPKAVVEAPDTAEHNRLSDDEDKSEDIFCCVLSDSHMTVNISKGIWLNKDYSQVFDLSIPGEASALTDDSCKDEIRGIIYDVFSMISGKKLPWGNLTGIRPTKLYLNKLLDEAKKTESDYSDESVVNTVIGRMRDIHRVGDEKGNLAAEIAVREQKLLDSLSGSRGYSVYIGIPFCPSTCLYCSFTSNPIFSYKDMIGDYIEAVRKELVNTSELMKDYILDTIYIGGGTPTTLEAGQLDTLLGYIVDILPMEHVREFTVEAGRPDSITREKLEVLRKYPVSRISVNPQTMSDKTLKFIGRNHTVGQLKDVYAMARELGFDNINMDIILGLPGEEKEDIVNTIEEIKAMAPDSLTVHSLAIKRASRLKQVMDEKGVSQMDTDEAMDIAARGAIEMGLHPYYLYRQKEMAGNLENTGFARDGKYGLYNILMMEEVQTIIACGAGTVTKRVYGDGRIERCDNVKDVGLYIEKIDEMIERKRRLFEDEK